MSLFFVFLIYIILNSLLLPSHITEPWLLSATFDLPDFMCYIIDSVNLVVFASNLSCFFLFYGSCQEYLVCFIALSVFFCFIHVSFRCILIDTRSIFNSFPGLQSPFLSVHAPVFTLLFIIDYFYITDNTLHSLRWLLTNRKLIRFVNMIIIFTFLFHLLE